MRIVVGISVVGGGGFPQLIQPMVHSIQLTWLYSLAITIKPGHGPGPGPGFGMGSMSLEAANGEGCDNTITEGQSDSWAVGCEWTERKMGVCKGGSGRA